MTEIGFRGVDAGSARAKTPRQRGGLAAPLEASPRACPDATPRSRIRSERPPDRLPARAPPSRPSARARAFGAPVSVPIPMSQVRSTGDDRAPIDDSAFLPGPEPGSGLLAGLGRVGLARRTAC